jgi:glycosyltransferase involved in cell wall biosynthesis
MALISSAPVAPTAAQLGTAAAAGLRVVIIGGSVKPAYCAMEAITELQMSGFAAHGADPVLIDVGDWRLRNAGALLRAVAAARPDVIFMHYPTEAFNRSLGPVGFGLLQRIAPFVVLLHEFSRINPLRRAAECVLAARAARILTTSELERNAVRRWLPWTSGRLGILQIPSNIPSRRWTPVEPPEVATFGQLRPDKGLEEFLACCRDLAAARPGLRFRIIGSAVPKFAAYADGIRRAAAADAVRMTEGLEAEAVAEQLAQASVALLPFPDGASFRRGSLLAAAACGVPIVSRHGRDTPDALARLLRLQPGTTQAAMVAQVLACLDDPAARSAAHRASLAVAKYGGGDRFVEECLQALAAAAQTPAAHRREESAK